jgi:hypothetical protein
LVCEGTGIPAVVVVTEVFVNLARTAARAHGYPDMRLVALPHPMESRPEAEVRAIARSYAAALFGMLQDSGT